MFIELAFIDWVALAFAAILLAGAAAAAVLAYATRQARTSEPKNGYAHAATAVTTTKQRSSVVNSAAAHAHSSNKVLDLADHKPIHAAVAEPQHAVARKERTLADDVESIPNPAVDAEIDIDTQVDVDPEIVADADADADAYADADADADAEVETGELPAMPMPAVKDAAEPVPAPGFVPDADAATKLASRAAKLRGRPVAERIASGELRAVELAEMPTPKSGASSPELDSSGRSVIGFSARVPGFFEDPMGRHELRYWDGSRWTEYVKESGERFTDPL